MTKKILIEDSEDSLFISNRNDFFFLEQNIDVVILEGIEEVRELGTMLISFAEDWEKEKSYERKDS